MSSSTQRSAALTERLQRLKAGLGNPRRTTPSHPPIPDTIREPARCVGETSPKLAKSTSLSSATPSEDYENLASFNGEAAAAQAQSDGTSKGNDSEAQPDSREGDFEIVSSPHEAIKAPSVSRGAGSSASAQRPCKATERTSRAEEATGTAATEVQNTEVEHLKQLLLEERERREDLSAQISALRSAYVEARDQRETASEDVLRLQQESNRLRRQLQDTTSASLKQAREEEAINVSRRLERAERAIEEERAAVVSLQQQLADSRKQAQANLDERTQASKLENALRGAEERASEAAAEIKRQVQQLRDLKLRNQDLSERLSSVGRQAAEEARQAAGNLEQSRRESEALRLENEQLKHLLADLERQAELCNQDAEIAREASTAAPCEAQQPDVVPAEPGSRSPRGASPLELAPQSAEPPLPYSRAESEVAVISAEEENGDSSTPFDEARSNLTAEGPAQGSPRAIDLATTKVPGALNEGGRQREAGWGLWAYISGADKTDSRN